MKRKLLLLGTVTCLTGIVAAGGAGCSSSETTVTEDAGGDVKRIVPDAADDDAGSCPVEVAGTAADLDAKNAWKPPVKGTAGACTSDDLTKFSANLKDTSLTLWTDYGTGLSDSCAKCIISADSADNWGPVVYTAASAGQKGFVNYGACYAYVDGDACGKAIQYTEYCLAAACNACAPDGTANDKCVSDALATNGTCAGFSATARTECKNAKKDDTQCESLALAVATVCGPAAITDGGSGDADADM